MSNTPPLCDNPSGEYCVACRETGLSHCAYPDECGGMQPMTHHEGCRHSSTTVSTTMSEQTEQVRLNGGEAVMGFIAFLTGLEQPVTAGSSHTVYDIMELARAFLKENNLHEETREDFHKRLKFPEDPRPALDEESEVRMAAAKLRLEHIEEASVTLVRKLDNITASEDFKSVFMLAKVHGCEYQGETFGAEVKELKEALGMKDAENEAATA